MLLGKELFILNHVEKNKCKILKCNNLEGEILNQN